MDGGFKYSSSCLTFTRGITQPYLVNSNIAEHTVVVVVSVVELTEVGIIHLS